MRILLPTLLLLSASGCLATRSYQTATSLGAGRVAVDVGAEVFPWVDLQHVEAGVWNETASAGLTYGFSDRVDGRFGVAPEGVTAELKWVAFQNRERGWALSTAPNATALYLGDAGGYSVELPLLVGYRIDPKTELTLGLSGKYAESGGQIFMGYFHDQSLTGSAAVSYHRWVSDYVHLYAGARTITQLGALETDLHTVTLAAGATGGVVFEFN